jgi:hypothetical protein
MVISKGAYLRQITAVNPMTSIDLGKELDGSSPPSVFIGSWNYPKVYAGPMISPLHGDTRVMDMPESWIPGGRTQEEILGFRMSLVRGKQLQDVRALDSRFVDQLQEIALSSSSIESEAWFEHIPGGFSLGEEHTPFGPSASLTQLEIGVPKYDPELERVFYDTDLPAGEGIIDLHERGTPFSAIQKALSAGTIGRERHRKLVPTRWSITACDTAIGKHLLSDVRRYETIDTVRVHEFSSLYNHYSVVLIPTPWQYEWMEAFLHISGNEEFLFSDFEWNRGKREYSSVGGCYYSCKMAVLEALSREQRQAGAIILREARKGYVPMGVFNVRENVRNAMLAPPVIYEDLQSALRGISPKFQLPVSRFIQESTVLGSLLREKQLRLSDFSCDHKNIVARENPGT